MAGYDDPQMATYRIPVAAIATAGTMATIVSPQGKKGRVHDIGYAITTDTTVAVAKISVGITGDLSKFSHNNVAIGVAGAVGNGNTHVAEIDADVPVLISSDGGCTAGAADLLVLINWY